MTNNAFLRRENQREASLNMITNQTTVCTVLRIYSNRARCPLDLALLSVHSKKNFRTIETTIVYAPPLASATSLKALSRWQRQGRCNTFHSKERTTPLLPRHDLLHPPPPCITRKAVRKYEPNVMAESTITTPLPSDTMAHVFSIFSAFVHEANLPTQNHMSFRSTTKCWFHSLTTRPRQNSLRKIVLGPLVQTFEQ